MKRLATVLATAALAALAIAPGAHAEFGLLPGPEGFDGSYTNQDGSPASQAGSRPFAITTSIRFTTTTDGNGETVPDGTVKDIIADLPPGFSGDFTQLPRCSGEQLNAMLFGSKSKDRCPIDSQVGVLTAYIRSNEESPLSEPIFNMVPPPGTPADFGVPVASIAVRMTPSVRTGSDYGISVSSLGTSSLEPLFGADVTFWGVPSDSSHDKERFPCLDPEDGITGLKCPVTFPPFPLFTMPTSCAGPLTTTLRVNSWQNPGIFEASSFLSHDEAGAPYGLHGCGLLGFAPSLTARPDTITLPDKQATPADSPTGLHVNLHQPQNDNPDGRSTSHLKETRIELPAGLATNPSAAAGLDGCTAAQADLEGPGVVRCPAASKLGTVRVKTPLVDDPLEGAIYLATPYENPFGSLLAVYLSVADPRTGVIVKLASAIETDEETGQLALAFDQIPQFPIEDTEVEMFGGPRAALRTPAICGEYVTESSLTPWSAPTSPVPAPDTFTVDTGPGGAPCAHSPAELPHEPSFEAATLFPVAGRHSPFVLNVERRDGEQELAGIDATLPPGLAAKFAGVAQCSDAAIAAAEARSGHHGGTEELEHPSCPAGSRIGTVTAGAGAGPQPFHQQGAVYLAGPYKGAPMSIVVITPAVAGPFDLGAVVVRSALYVDPVTAQGRAVSDPIPTILEGIPLDLRSVSLVLDRREFILNPTNCSEMQVSSRILSSLGALATPSNRFQVDECGKLGFKPKLSLRLFGGTHRGAHPKLRAVVKARPGDANIAGARVTLPRSEFLDQSHIRTVCTRVQFAAKACPAGSIYGHAEAITPLFDQPLEGPVYLRSSSNPLPDLLALLRGPDSLPVEVDLVGRIDSKNGGIRNSFEVVPDAPVTKFTLTMQGGKKGLLVNSTDLCAKTNRAVAKFTGQNGKRITLRPALKNGCKKGSGRSGSAKGKRKGHRRAR